MITSTNRLQLRLSRAVAAVRGHPLLTPLLIVYTAINVIALPFEYRPSFAPVNLVLLIAYVSVIHFATAGRTMVASPLQRPNGRSRDVGLAITVAVMQMTAATVVWFVILPHGAPGALAAYLRSAGLPSLIAGRAVNAILTVALQLVPTAVAVAVFRVGLRDVGLTLGSRDLLLGLVLSAMAVGVGIGAAAAGTEPGLLWQSVPAPIVAAVIALQSLVNGVPEEFAFRGVIFGRLMPWLGRPGNSLVVSTMAWGLLHVPFFVAGSHIPLWLAIPIGLFGTIQGLVFGYLFYRTRSIWPSAIWHTSISGLGLMFI